MKVICQQFKSGLGGAQPLTSWMGFHCNMSAIQSEPRGHTATHLLDGISWQHVSNTNWAQEVHSHSPAGWNFMAACQKYKLNPGGAQPLTIWMGFHVSMSAIQIEPRRCTTTHSLDGISWQHVSNTNQAQDVHSHSQTRWDFMMVCQWLKSSPGGAQQLTFWDESFLCCQSKISYKTCILPPIHYIQNLPSYHFKILTFSPLSFA